jgi:hypothetical protein
VFLESMDRTALGMVFGGMFAVILFSEGNCSSPEWMDGTKLSIRRKVDRRGTNLQSSRRASLLLNG